MILARFPASQPQDKAITAWWKSTNIFVKGTGDWVLAARSPRLRD
ncbi:MAG: hypothetical protein V7L31_11410 [Nostoc sp.]